MTWKPRGGGIGCDNGLEMRQKIGLSPGWATGGSHDLTRDDIATEDERTSAVTYLLKFPSLHFPRNQRQARMLAF